MGRLNVLGRSVDAIICDFNGLEVSSAKDNLDREHSH